VFGHTAAYAVGLTGIPEDKVPSGEGWTGLTKPALSISALQMRLIAARDGCKKLFVLRGCFRMGLRVLCAGGEEAVDGI
jgi:hypothetical protein